MRHQLGLTGALACAALVGFLGAVTTGSAAPKPLRYVALGDSFSSGEGVPPFRSGTNDYLPVRDTCHRSFRAYPSLIAARRSSPGNWAFWACSGARVGDMTHTNHENPGEIPQLDRIAPPGRSNPRIDLVTLTIGGNDAQFGPATLACVAARAAPGLGLCRPTWRVRVESEVERLRTTLPPLFRALRTRAPRARLLVLGYPDPFPAVAPALSPCRLWFAPGDLRWLSRQARALNEAVRAATVSSRARVTYLAPSGFGGHDVCSAAPWFNGLDVIPTRVRWSFHPNALGQRRLASIALAAL